MTGAVEPKRPDPRKMSVEQLTAAGHYRRPYVAKQAAEEEITHGWQAPDSGFGARHGGRRARSGGAGGRLGQVLRQPDLARTREAIAA